MRIVLAIILIALYLPYLGRKSYFSPIDHINLAFHEGGHVLLFFMPKFMMVLGGTVFQLALPAACAVHFWKQGSVLGSWAMVWWVGENFLNISRYIADARRQVLPLVGSGEHDWTYLLGEVGLLSNNVGVAQLVFLLGTGLCFFAVYKIIRPGATASA